MRTQPLRRFGFGIVLPIRLIATALRTPRLAGAYVQTILLQAVFTALLFATICCVWSAPLARLREELSSRDFDHAHKDAALLVAILYGCQWIVLALSKDYTDQLSRGVSLAAALPPEDPERPANLRIDPRWVKKKVQRRVRAIYLYAVGIPAITLVSLPVGVAISWLTGVDAVLYSILTALWAAYWAVVGVTSKTAYAWNEPPAEIRPWFVRLLERVERFALLGWYVRWVKKASSSVRGPTLAFERAPAPLAGLAFARALTGVPLLSIAVRPLVPVAVAKILQIEGASLTAGSFDGASRERASTS